MMGKSVTRRLGQYFKPYWKSLTLGAVCTVLATLVTLAIPWVIGKDFIDSVVMGGRDLSTLNIIALALLVIFVGKGFLSYGQTYLISGVTYGVVADIRSTAYEHLQSLSLRFYKKRRTGEIMSRLISDVDVIQNAFVNELPRIIGNLLLLVGVLVFIFYIHWRLSLLVLIVVPLLALAVSKFSSWIRHSSSSIQGKMADISSILQETVTGIEVIKSFATEQREIKRFRQENIRNLRLNLQRTRLVAILTPLVEIVALSGGILILWFGGREVVGGTLTMGELVAFLGYIGLVINPVSDSSRIFGIYQQVLASAERVFEILDTEPDIREDEDALVLPRISGSIVFRDVSFSYTSNEPVLKHIDLEVKPGELIALVGPSGVGKTTLVSLVLRLYDPTRGLIAVDGHDIRHVHLASLRKQIGVVPQDTILFSGTIRENIAYSKPAAADEELREAAAKANAHLFITQLNDGYETVVGERGVTLSGGQKQRIAIARAILRDPRILILDEATSAVDTESEVLIQQALEGLMENRTTLIIAHRLSTVQKANRIIVLDSGQIVEVGTHQELLRMDGKYARLYQMQFKANET